MKINSWDLFKASCLNLVNCLTLDYFVALIYHAYNHIQISHTNTWIMKHIVINIQLEKK
jgi:hypothetical protein